MIHRSRLSLFVRFAAQIYSIFIQIRDATFVVNQHPHTDEDFNHDDDGTSPSTAITMFVISSTGFVYVQPMNEGSSASLGPFYVTERLEIQQPDLQVFLGYGLNLVCEKSFCFRPTVI